MEDMRRVAKAAYANFTEEEKREMKSVFKSMDNNGDGKISLHEFTARYGEYTQNFFRLLDQNGDGFLQFEELLTLSYITASGRPFCAACKDFIPGLFFTCTQCRLSNKPPPLSYDLCINCYHGGKFEHQHDEFDDNYTLLLKLQEMLLSAQRAEPSQSAQSSTSPPSKAKPSQSAQSSASPPPKIKPSDQSGPTRRRTRLKLKMKKSFRKFGEALSTAATVTGIVLPFTSIDDEEGGGGDDGDDDRDNDNDETAADDPKRS